MAKKIGIVIAADGEREFTQALTNINKSLQVTRSEAAKVKTEYEGQSNSLEALTAVQAVFSKRLEEQRQKQEAVRKGLEHSRKNYKAVQDSLEDLKKKLSEAEAKQQAMAESGEASGKELKEQEKTVKELTRAVERQEKELPKCENKIKTWQQRLNTADKEVIIANRDLNKNAAYMREAAEASDGCAKSIDKFGKATKNNKIETGWAEKLANAGVEKGVSMAVDAIGQLKDKAIDAAKYAVEAGSAFEAAMSQVSAVSGATGDDLAALEEKAREMGASTKFSATEAAEAMNYMAMAGWKTGDMLDGIGGVMNLAAASGEDLATTSDIVTDALTALGMSAEDSGHFADILAAASSNANTNVSMMGETFKYCAPVAGALGFTAEDTAEAIGLMANAGIKSSQAGTAMRTMLTSLTGDVKLSGEQLGDFVVKATETDGSMRSLGDILADCREAFGQMSESEQAANAEALVGKNAMSGFLAVMNAAPADVQKLNQAITECDGAAAGMAATMQDNLSGKITLMNSALEGLGIAAFEYVEGPLSGIVEGITEAINGIAEAVTVQKTELDEFVEGVEQANEQIQGTLEAADKALSDNDKEIADLERYKDILLEINSAASANTYQQEVMAKIISQLSESIPGLAAAFDAETSSISLSDEAITGLFEEYENFLTYTAAVESHEQAVSALADAELNAQKAADAYGESKDDANTAMAKYTELVKAGVSAEAAYAQAYTGVGDAAGKAVREQEKANKAVEEAKARVDSTGKTVEELEGKLGDYADAAAEAADSSDGFSASTGEMADAAAEAAEEAADAYEAMRVSIANSIEESVDLFDKFSGGAEISAKDVVKNLDSQIDGIGKWSDNMQKLAAQAGKGMTQEFYDYLANMGPESANLVQTLVDELEGNTGQFEAICAKWAEAMELQNEADVIAGYTSASEGIPVSIADTIKNGAVQIQSAATEAAGSGAASAKSQYTQYRQTGVHLAAGLAANTAVAAAGRRLAKAALDAAKKEAGVNSPSRVFRDEVGRFLPAGMAKGMLDGAKEVEQASRGLAKATLQASKEELEIHSPSAKFKNSVGKQIAKGTAFGISAGKGEAVKASKSLAKDVYKSAVSWMDSYAASHKVSLEDEKYFWKQLAGTVKKGTDEYKKAVKAMNAIDKFEGTVNSKVKSGFGVSKTTKSGSKTKKKSTSDYQADVVSAAQKWLDNYKVVHETSLAEEEYYWQQVIKKLEKGSKKHTQAWYDAKKELKSVQDQQKKQQEAAYADIVGSAEKYVGQRKTLNKMSVAQEQVYWEKILAQIEKSGGKYTDEWYSVYEKIQSAKENVAAEASKKAAAQANVQASLLDNYKVYRKVSEKAEMEYWNIARKQFKAGTQERIDADRQYFEAKQEYEERLAELKEEKAEKEKDIQDTLIEKQKELNDAYEDALKSRKAEILSSMNLFEAWDSEGYKPDKLMWNLKTQVEGLKVWEQTLEDLGQKGLSEGLMEELRNMGPDAAANLYSLNEMTAEQLAEYNALWEEKSELAHRQAVEDNMKLWKETEDSISEAKRIAQDEIAVLEADYRSAVAELDAGLSDGLKGLVEQSAKIGEEIVSNLVNAIKKATTGSETKDALEKAAKIIDSSANSAAASASSSKTSSGSTSSSKKEDKILTIINTGKSRSKKLTAAEEKEHAEIWKYLVKKYGKAPSNTIYKSLGSELGVKTSSTVTGAQKNSILKQLKLKGYSSGVMNLRQHELAWTQEQGPEIIVRGDGAVLTPLAAGSSVIPAQLSKNLMEWGKTTPQAYLSGVARLNRLVENSQQKSAVVTVDNRGITPALERILNGIERIASIIGSGQMVLDTGALVGELQPALSRKSAEVAIRRNRGRR